MIVLAKGTIEFKRFVKKMQTQIRKEKKLKEYIQSKENTSTVKARTSHGVLRQSIELICSSHLKCSLSTLWDNRFRHKGGHLGLTPAHSINGRAGAGVLLHFPALTV